MIESLNKWLLNSQNTYFHVFIWPLTSIWPWTLTHKHEFCAWHTTLVNICAKLYSNPSMHMDVLLQTSVSADLFVWPWPLTYRPGSCVQHFVSWWWSSIWTYIRIPPSKKKICSRQNLDISLFHTVFFFKPIWGRNSAPFPSSKHIYFSPILSKNSPLNEYLFMGELLLYFNQILLRHVIKMKFHM